ncbi:HNH endonuclease signature motif containing protein [Mycolicibacterium celeriflavum]|uniref:HNH endonuclease signature motif containing protein n=1 Tax=Mycolicibacterium celeriflavum TaxID=1249101 RepID=UPI003CEC7757
MFEDASSFDLLTLMGEEAREESAAMGRRLALVAELYARRVKEHREARMFLTDVAVVVAAEISPVQNISHARALGQVHAAKTLHERLPRVAEIFRRGWIDYRVVSTIMSRTENVEDDIMPALDEALAAKAEKWMKLSGPKLIDRVDMFVGRFDPETVRVPRSAEDNRHVIVEPGCPGMAWVGANLRAADGAALDNRLDALAATVCDNDPRTKDQRRADACGPLSRMEATMPCECGLDDCPAAAKRAATTTAIIHVLAEQATLDGTSNKPGYLKGFGVMPAESVREAAKNAQLKPLITPDTNADNGYRPSVALREFLQWRDLTCRWPGCDKPVQRCDVDHTVPWPQGPTHPSNTKHYCRTHHLIKTFFGGPQGWTDRQLSDGTIELIAPTGHVWRTEPHGASMFPALGQPMNEFEVPAEISPESGDRVLMMPRRKQSREDDRRDRIKAERRQRAELIAEEERQRQAWLAANYQPPPF